MNEQERDELGRIVRGSLQAVGISNGEAWDQIGERRRERHREAADLIYPAIKAWEAAREAEQKAEIEGVLR